MTTAFLSTQRSPDPMERLRSVDASYSYSGGRITKRLKVLMRMRRLGGSAGPQVGMLLRDSDHSVPQGSRPKRTPLAS